MFTLLIIIFILSPISTIHAGAWTIEPNKWERYHNITYYSTDYYYDTNGKRKDQDRYTKIEKDHIVEYGWQDGITIGNATSLAAVLSNSIISSTSNVTGWNYGIADPKFYLRKRLWQYDAGVLSTQATIKLPSVYENNDRAFTGSDKTSFELKLLSGNNFNLLDKSHFSDIGVSYEKRPWNNSDLIHADATVGFHASDSLTIMPQIFSTWRVSVANTGFSQSGDDAYDLMKGQLSAILPISKTTSLQIGAFHTIYGRNTGGGSGATVSFWIKK